MIKKTRTDILLVDDHAGILLGTSAYLEQHISCVQTISFTEGFAAAKQIQGQKYDIYIVDIELPDIGGMELIKRIKFSNSEAKIIIYTLHQGIWDIINFQKAGVAGIVIKGSDLAPLKNAVLTVLRGEFYMCEQFRYLSTPYNDLNQDSILLDGELALTDAEMEIIQLLAKGLSYREISDNTGYALTSIPKKKDRIFKKLYVNSIGELVAKTITNGFPVKQETKKRKGY